MKKVKFCAYTIYKPCQLLVTHACLMNTEKAALQMYSNQQLPAFTEKVKKNVHIFCRLSI